MGKGRVVKGAVFKARSFFRGTTMSIAMADAGIIPAPHIIKDRASTALLRQPNDNRNQRPSLLVAF